MIKQLENKLEFLLKNKYKWYELIKYNIKVAGSGSFVNFMGVISNVIFITALMYIWSTKSASQEIFTYLLIGRIYKSIGENYFYGTLSYDILIGKLSNKLLLPTSIFFHYFFLMIGRRIFRNLLELIGYTISTILCVYFFIAPIFNLLSALFILLLVPITFFINHLIGSLVGCIAFNIKNKRDFDGIDKVWNRVRDVVSGGLIPLSMLPYSGFFSILPTSFILHHPMQIYLGKYNSSEIIMTFVGGISWCFVLFILARVVFKIGMKKNEAVGL